MFDSSFFFPFLLFFAAASLYAIEPVPTGTPLVVKEGGLAKVVSVVQAIKQGIKKESQQAAKVVKEPEVGKGTDVLMEEKRAQPIDLPAPVGEEMKGIIIPQYDTNGKLTMNFYAATARKLDEHQVELHDLKVEFFETDGKDVTVMIPHGIFNLETKILGMDTETKIQREDFNMVGESGDFDTIKRLGTMKGHVHMEIRNGGTPAEL